MKYIAGIIRALIPHTPLDAALVLVCAPVLAYVGYMALLKDVPHAIRNSETQYPQTVERDSYFWLTFDLTFDQTCTMNAQRIITGSDDVEYVASEEKRDVVAGVPIQYNVRVPVTPAIPYGVAYVRSDFLWQCDLWSRYIRARPQRGINRQIKIVPAGSVKPSVR